MTSSNSIESLLAKFEDLVGQVNFSDGDLLVAAEPELSNLLGTIVGQLKQEQLAEKKYRHLLETFIRHIPLAVAILDSEMNYLATSDRWISNYNLEAQDLIGQNHYEVFPEIPDRWRQAYQDCLQGRVKILNRAEDFLVRQSGKVDWLRWQVRPWYDECGQIGGLLIFSEILTDKQQLQQKIESTEKQMRAVFACMSEFVFTVDRDSETILILPTKFLENYEFYPVDRIIAQTQNLLFHSRQSNACQALVRRVLRQQKAIDFEYSIELDNALIWFAVEILPISATTVIWIARDITNRKETEQDILHAQKELAHITLKSIGDGVITTNSEGRIQFLNPIAERLTGWKLQTAQGRDLNEVFCLYNGLTKQAIANPIDRVVRNRQIYELTAKNYLLDRHGTSYEVEGLASPIMNRYDRPIGTVIVFRDVTSTRKMARKLSWQETHDPLTKLYNRRRFEEFAQDAIQNAHSSQANHVLCYLNLDRFKIVNDTCGHIAGDKLLRQVAALLNARVRNSDIFARLGGDEFGIIFRQSALRVAAEFANQLTQLIEDFRFIWGDKVFRIGLSVGLVEINSATADLTSLLSSADAACYAAKQQGGSYVYICHQPDVLVAKQRGERQWIEKINHALEEDDFQLYAQKIVPIGGGRVEPTSGRHHQEILIRLRDKSGKITMPGSFLPAAERYGLMPAIDRWVIGTFFAGYEKYCQSRPAEELALTQQLYTINLSGASINSREFGSFLQAQFDRYAVPLQTICFEITETVAIANLDNANILIERLKNAGCSIALDDFGSGMSSLTYLKNLPIDYLKIDGSFVTNIAKDKVDYATVECFNHISQIMNIKTIAEFVENGTILSNLKQIGIDYAQGYGIERPKPLIWQ